MKKALLIPLLFVFNILANESEDTLKKIYAQLVIENSTVAIELAQNALKKTPKDPILQKVYLMALSEGYQEKEAVAFFHLLKNENKNVSKDLEMIRDVGWAVLRRSLRSSQPQTRMMGLIGAYLTKDVRAVKVIRERMQDPHDVLRLIATELSSYYRDQILQEQLIELLKTEKSAKVRISAIRSIGKMQIASGKLYLEKSLENEQTSVEERAACIQALLELYDKIELEKIKQLSKSPFAGLRKFACEIATHQKMDKAKDLIWALLDDPRTDVRLSALNSIGIYYRKIFSLKQLKEKILEKTQDINPNVSITACWVLLIIDPKEGQKTIEPWLHHEISYHRHYAATVLASSGEKNLPFMFSIMGEHQDPFVCANLAIGCIGFRSYIDESCNVLYHTCKSKKGLWMMDEFTNPLFSILSPSYIQFTDSIPNYPQAVDQMTRLKILSLLAIVDDPRAEEGIRKFLQSKKWGITGFAAATLLSEGDQDAMKHVRDLLKDPDPQTQVQAALVLAYFYKDPSVVPFLLKAYQTVDHEMKFYILEAMGKIPSEDSRDFLMDALKEPFQNLRIAAAASLLQSMH